MLRLAFTFSLCNIKGCPTSALMMLMMIMSGRPRIRPLPQRLLLLLSTMISREVRSRNRRHRRRHIMPLFTINDTALVRGGRLCSFPPKPPRPALLSFWAIAGRSTLGSRCRSRPRLGLGLFRGRRKRPRTRRAEKRKQMTRRRRRRGSRTRMNR